MAKLTVIEGKDVSEENQNLEEKIRSHNMRRNTILVIVLVLVVLLLIGYWIYRTTKKYKDYEVLYSLDKESGDNSKCLKYKDGFLKYDSNGIIYYDSKNNVKWQISYEMRNPQVKVCKDYIGIANIGGSSIYILDSTGLVKTIDTALSISEIEVSSVGTCTVTLEDGLINYIRMFDTKGNVIYDLKKIISGEGYPVDIAVSEDAKKLCVSGLYFDGNTPKSKLYFYNFSEVGKNEIDYYVGGYDFEGVVPKVEFVENDLVAAIGENTYTLYSMEQYPSMIAQTTLDYEIDKLFIGGNYVGFVHTTEDNEKPYTLEVYNYKGKKKLTYKYEEDFTEAIFMKDYIMLSNSGCARMIDYLGYSRFEYSFDIPMQGIVWVEGATRFTFINAKSIQQIKLK